MNATVLEVGEVLAMPRIHDELWDQYGASLQAAANDVVEAQAATEAAYGDWAP